MHLDWCPVWDIFTIIIFAKAKECIKIQHPSTRNAWMEKNWSFKGKLNNNTTN